MKENMSIKLFKSYIAGLFEGDGHIWFPNLNLKKKHNPRFCITFNLKDKYLAENILKSVGYGFIRLKPKNSACVLTISPVKGLKEIIELINGECKTPKIIQLHNLIDWINKNHNSNIIKLPLNKEDISKNNWLTGFVDADGSFSIQHTKLENGAKKRKISCRLRIEQRMFEPLTKNSYGQILRQIALFLGCNLKTRKQKSTNNEYFNITASSRKSLLIIIDYFNKYPLYSSKYLDYKDWKEATLLLLKNEHYTQEGIKKIDILKNQMNRNRSFFTWDHI